MYANVDCVGLTRSREAEVRERMRHIFSVVGRKRKRRIFSVVGRKRKREFWRIFSVLTEKPCL